MQPRIRLDADIDAVVRVFGAGGGPGHAPAGRTYEKAGLTGLPLVRYYKACSHRARGSPQYRGMPGGAAPRPQASRPA
jgi:hypothetical protein